MKENPKCYGCVYCSQCDQIQEKNCKETNYELFTTEADKKMCDMMCGLEEKES